MGNRYPKPVNNLSNSNKIPTPTVAGGGGTTAYSGETVPPSGRIVTPDLKCFTYYELKSATRNFRPDTMLGEGGFGRVFKGWVDSKTYPPSKVDNGIAVAVKRSNQDRAQSLKEWQAEVNFLGKFSHPKLVKLVGYCWDDREALLVYEYMQKGSLENHLFKRGAEPLPWSTRIKIAIGVAQGLAFLHTTEIAVIYRDFKTANILLDGDYNAKLSDFALAKLSPGYGDSPFSSPRINGNSHVSRGVVGTSGYAAPEYIVAGHLSVKSDVYSFGVVLLEMITGQRVLNNNNRLSVRRNLVDWARPALIYKRRLIKLMDPQLENDYPSKGATKAAQLIYCCLEPNPKCRPKMSEVMVMLQEISTIKTKPKEVKVHTTQRSGPHRDRRYQSTHQSPLHMKQGGRARPDPSPIRSY